VTLQEPLAQMTAEAAPAPTQVAARGLTANLSALATSQAITWSVTLGWTLVVPRLLGPAQMGVLVSSMAATAILGVVLGLPTREFLAREMVARPAEARSLLGTAMLLRLCLVPVFFVLIEAYAHLTQLEPRSRTVLHLCTGVVVCTLLTEPALAAFQAKERMENLAVYEVLSKTLQGLGGIVLVLVGARVVGLSGFNFAVAGVVALLMVRRVQRLIAIDWRPDLTRTWTLVRASAPFWTFGVFYMIYLWIDSVMLGLMVPSEVVGWYGVATKLFTTMMFVPVIMSTAWLPRLVRAHEQGPDQLARAARLPITLVFVLSLPLCVGTAVLAGDVLPLLYGSSYANAGPALAVLALCFPPMYTNIMLYQVMIASRRPGPGCA
jgi:O-antigen/teichoic acid export membrane protein